MTRHRKNKTSPLKKAREFFQRNDISDTESSDSSVESQENSHIPLQKEVPSLANLFLEPNDDMEQIVAELKRISEQMQNLSARQTQYEQRLDNINHNDPLSEISDEEEIQGPLGPTNAVNVMESLSKIPDPIKSIPPFDGSVKQLNAWITSTEKTLSIFKPLVPANVFAIYEQAVINKLQGKAKDAICMAQYPLTFADAKKILITALGERQELSAYKSKLWKNKQGETTSVHKYYQRTKYLVENIKALARQDKDYAQAWNAVCKFIDQDALAAFVSGLNEFYFGHALAARPKSLDDAYAFLCEFHSSEKIARGEKKKKEYQGQKDKHKDFHKYEKPKNRATNEEPMEIDPSLRSRLTLNKRNINNHEADQSDTESESEQETETPELNVNFQIAPVDQEKS